MNIDIKRFALLTSAIAASVTVVATAATGCSSKAVDDTDLDAGDDDTTSSSSGGSSSGGGDGGGSSSSSSSGGSSSGDGGATDAGSCLSGGEPIVDEDAFCALTEGSETCSGDEYFDGLCRGPAQNFIPAVAEAAVECIKTSPICESDPTYACLDEAVAKACDDATAEALCTGLAAANNCEMGPNGASPYTVADCVAIAKAMNTAGRDALTTCFEDSVQGTTCNDEAVGDCFTTNPYSYGFPADL